MHSLLEMQSALFLPTHVSLKNLKVPRRIPPNNTQPSLPVAASSAAAVYGLQKGFKESPVRRGRILLNSVLNGASKYSCRAGNAIGSIALIYSAFDWGIEELLFPQLGVDRYVDTHEATPVLAGALTGAVYKSSSALFEYDTPEHVCNMPRQNTEILTQFPVPSDIPSSLHLWLTDMIHLMHPENPKTIILATLLGGGVMLGKIALENVLPNDLLRDVKDLFF